MKLIINILTTYLILIIFSSVTYADPYPWLDNYDDSNTVENRISPPDGFHRIDTSQNSFTNWLRQFQLKEKGAKVFLYNGEEKSNKTAYHAVMNIDTGDRDLQQCADAVIRLRSEFLFSFKRFDEIRFNFTSGDACSFRRWIEGFRPVVDGNDVSWIKSGNVDSSYANFRNYLDTVFMYCGTYSLNKELLPVEDISEIQPGDVFIQGGFPGHAIIVLDIAENYQNDKLCLLGQGFTPAQDIHILKNPNNPDLNPWYDINFGEILNTPEWTFKKKDLRRFK